MRPNRLSDVILLGDSVDDHSRSSMDELPSSSSFSSSQGASRSITDILSRNAIEIPVSPTTRSAANAQNGTSRQSIPLRPLKLGVIVHRESLKIDTQEKKRLYLLEFTVDCCEQVCIKLCLIGKSKLLSALPIEQIGLNIKIGMVFELKSFKAGTAYDFLLLAEPLNKGSPTLRTRVTAHPVADSEGHFTASCPRQTLTFKGKEYELLEIYGQFTEPASREEEEEKNLSMRDVNGGSFVSINIKESRSQDRSDCVICLSQTRNTLFIPCRHMCICVDCAEPLVNGDGKCPLCRQPFESMISIKEELPSVEALSPTRRPSLVVKGEKTTVKF